MKISRMSESGIEATDEDLERFEAEGVSHFAPLQRPEQFNHAILAFLDKRLS
jgi:pimeloyl-ACP methyl ester carboxylesterase